MKKLLVLLILILIFTVKNAFSQHRIGSSLSEVQTEFQNSKYETDILNRIDGTVCGLIVKTQFSNIVYMFNEFDICNSTLIRPLNDLYFKWNIETYNENYVQSKPNEWVSYTKDGVFVCKLIINKDMRHFLWRRLEE